MDMLWAFNHTIKQYIHFNLILQYQQVCSSFNTHWYVIVFLVFLFYLTEFVWMEEWESDMSDHRLSHFPQTSTSHNLTQDNINIYKYELHVL